jgi:chromosome segregation ATPase
MDTSVLKRELDSNKSKLEAANQNKRNLNSDILSLKTKVTAYKRDYEEVESKLTKKTKELEEIENQITKYAKEVTMLEGDFRKMLEELKRAQANTNGAPTKKSGW